MLQCLADSFNLAAPGANTAFPTTALQPNNKGRLELAIVLTNAAVLSVTITRGGSAADHLINEGIPLAAGAMYAFSFPCSKDSTYQFKISVDGIVKIFQVNEYWE